MTADHKMGFTHMHICYKEHFNAKMPLQRILLKLYTFEFLKKGELLEMEKTEEFLSLVITPISQ